LKRKLQLVRLLPGALLALGVTVMLGWVAHIAPLTTVVPGMVCMVFNTALCFALLGAGLHARFWTAMPAQRTAFTRGCAAATVVLALLSLLQIASGMEFGINLPGLHAWNTIPGLAPGQMSMATALCFILAGVSVLLLDRRELSYAAPLARGLVVACFAIGMLAAYGYALNLEPLYSWYPMSRMALHTAVGMMVLGIALWHAWSSAERIYREERQIVSIGIGALVVVALLSASTGIWVLRREGGATIQQNLQISLKARTDLLALALDQRSGRATVVSRQPELAEGLRQLARTPGDSGLVTRLRAALEAELPIGFNGIELLNSEGIPLVWTGQPIIPDPGLAANIPGPGQASLAWNNGLVLHNRIPIRDRDGLAGFLLSEQSLDGLQHLLQTGTDNLDLTICGKDMASLSCLGTDGRRPVSDSALLPMIRLALGGTAGTGENLATTNGESIAVYGPVRATGLAALLQVNPVTLYAPIHRGLLWGFLLVVAIVAFSAAWLQRRVRSLAARLARSEGRYKAVVDSLHEGLVLLGADGHTLATNPAAAQILGLNQAGLKNLGITDGGWHVVREDGKPWPAGEFPVQRTLLSGDVKAAPLGRSAGSASIPRCSTCRKASMSARL
jgi:PAS domain-containing protein